jgi:nitrogen regulatory protein PII
MELLVCVINEEGKLEDILAGFLELGITGATIIDSQGMARHLNEAPVVMGLQELISQARPQNKTVFSVIESAEKLQAAVEMIRHVCGDMDKPGTGILFTVPLDRVVGLSRTLGSEAG